jgi:YcxB-like protein
MTITLHYTEAVLRNAIVGYLWRAFIKNLLVPSILAIAVLVLALFWGSPWLQAFTVVPIIMIPTMFALGYWIRIRESLKRFRRLEDGQVHLTINDSGVIAESSIGKSETTWAIYTHLDEFPECYLLFYSGSQFITLPKDQVSPEFVPFIRNNLGKS